MGIIGCGAIGSRIAKTISQDLAKDCSLTALYDIDLAKSRALAKHLRNLDLVKSSLKELLCVADFVVEAVASKETAAIIRTVLEAKKDILIMSVGQLLLAEDLFQLADQNKCSVLIPSGAIAGLDAIKAAVCAGIEKITLTTRKPPSGFSDNPYVKNQGINLDDLHEETTLFEGTVKQALHHFPKNINVAATLALAGDCSDSLQVRIITSPHVRTNSHEIEAIGEFGRISTKTDNAVCPDNPKTSYLAVLSAIVTLKEYLRGVKIGT